ncbi:hypothetical protein FACS189413_10650 [Bacteroidia bacterium]|nr:hypothetical protein FACS189413_10650 [Bacteroidia bacterium]
MKSKIILISLFCIFAASAQAQGIAEWLQTARTAFENGEYRTVLTNVAKIEEEVGSATKPATAYLRIMSHYRLREYEKCVSSANAYLAAKPAQDETLTEIRTALSDAKEQIRLAEVAKQKKLVEQEAERQRQTELARQKAAFEQEAADRWAQLQTTTDLSALQTFVGKYKDTPSATTAQSRYDRLKKEADLQAKYRNDYAQLEKKLTYEKSEVKRMRNFAIVTGSIGVVGIGGGIVILNKKVEEDDSFFKKYGGVAAIVLGSVVGITGVSLAIPEMNTSKRNVERIEREMNTLRPKMQLSLQPQVMQINPYSKDLAYGVGIRFTF